MRLGEKGNGVLLFKSGEVTGGEDQTPESDIATNQTAK